METNVTPKVDSQAKPQSDSQAKPLAAALHTIETALKQVIVSQEAPLHQLMVAMTASGHVLLEGVPGIAKTLMAKSLATSVRGEFKRIQFTPDLLPTDIVGTKVYNQKEQVFEVHKGPVFSNFLLADEINRTPAKTQSGLLEAMTEGFVSIAGEAIPLPSPYMVVATQNPLEFDGTYQLPEALVDRFLMKIIIDYPTSTAEIDVLKRHHTGVLNNRNATTAIDAVIGLEELSQLQQAAQAVQVEERLFKYMVTLVGSSRTHEAVDLGASPRGTVALMQASKAEALIQGRDYVIPEDIKNVFAPVMRHRLRLKPEFELEGLDVEVVLKQLLLTVEVPR